MKIHKDAFGEVLNVGDIVVYRDNSFNILIEARVKFLHKEKITIKATKVGMNYIGTEKRIKDSWYYNNDPIVYAYNVSKKSSRHYFFKGKGD